MIILNPFLVLQVFQIHVTFVKSFILNIGKLQKCITECMNGSCKDLDVFLQSKLISFSGSKASFS